MWTSLDGCIGLIPVEDMTDLAQVFHEPIDLALTIAQAVIFKREQVKQDLAEIGDKWNQGEFYEAG